MDTQKQARQVNNGIDGRPFDESQALQAADGPYKQYYGAAKASYLSGGTGALRMQIGKLNATAASLESSLNTQKSFPSLILSFTSVFISAIMMLYNFYNQINTSYDTAARLRSVFGEAADQYIQSINMEQVINELIAKNNTIMWWSCSVGAALIIAIIVSMVLPLCGLNKKKKEFDLCHIQQSAYQQLLEEVLNGEVTTEDLLPKDEDGTGSGTDAVGGDVQGNDTSAVTTM